ncbi:hypothetical protein BDP27DRAFT_1431182 [Rhodocollybia butyracea]|uniref:Uncharacterized protein n=1 Tax=Rhodocollybia butyracea TaxID=206335 RepID=A0A9P5TXL7_9AGAR|nr:hypothetical protein BDP27DRAFT_1431182 [Rhodocollybia butyracea]
MSFAEPPLPDALAQSEQASEIEAPGLDPETGEMTPTETGLTSSAGSLEDQNTHAAGTEAPGLDSEAGESTLTEAGLTSPLVPGRPEHTYFHRRTAYSTIGESTWTETDLVASPANSLDDQNPQVPTNELLEAVENHEEVSEAEASSEAVENRKSNVDVDFSTTVADGKYDETGTEEGDATPLARTQSPGPDTELNSSAPATTLDPAPELNAPEFQIEFDSGDPPQLGEERTSTRALGSTDPSFTQEDESTESSVKDPSSAETSLTSSDDPLLPKDYSHFLDAAQPLDTNTATLDAVNNLDLSAFDDSDAESNYFDSPEEPHDEGAFYAQ